MPTRREKGKLNGKIGRVVFFSSPKVGVGGVGVYEASAQTACVPDVSGLR